MPMRVSALEESIGMDVVDHGEQAYTDGEGAILVAHEGFFDFDRSRRDAD